MSRVFNGTSDWMTYSGAVVSGTPYTFACWHKPDGIADSTTRTLISLGDSGVTNAYTSLQQFNASAYVYTTSGGTTGQINVTGLTAAAWHHQAFVSSGDASRISYCDGTASTTNTTSVAPTLNQTRIGGRAQSGATPNDLCKGKLAHAAIWNVALSGSDISSLAAGANPTTIQPGNLVAYWPLEGTASPEPDLINSFNMTLSGTTGDTGDNPTVDPYTVLLAGAINSAYSGTTVTPVLPTHATGDVLIVAGLKNDAATALSVSGWTAIATESNANLSSGAWYKTATSGAESNPVITSTTSASSTAGLFGQCFKAPAASFSTIVNATWNGSPTSSTTPAGSTISTMSANALAVTLGLIDASSAFSSGLPPTGWTKVSDVSASTSSAPTVQAVSTAIQSATTGTTVTVTLPAHATNDILLVCGNYSFASSTLTCGTSGWTKIDGTANANLSTAWFYKRAASGAETNPVITSTATASGTASLYGAAMVIRGCVTSGTPYEGATKSTVTSTSAPSTSALTTNGPSRLAVEFATTRDNNVETAPSGWTASLNISTTTGSDSAFFGNTKTIAAAGTESAAAYSMTLGPDYHQGLTLAFIPPDAASGRITTIEKEQASAGSVTGATIGTLAAAAYWKTVTFSLEAATSTPSSFLARRPMPAHRGLRGRRH